MAVQCEKNETIIRKMQNNFWLIMEFKKKKNVLKFGQQLNRNKHINNCGLPAASIKNF